MTSMTVAFNAFWSSDAWQMGTFSRAKTKAAQANSAGCIQSKRSQGSWGDRDWYGESPCRFL